MPDDELRSIADARLGRVLKGKYRLDRVLGIGGMATVYAATHRNKKRVAIKMLHPELSIRENIRSRFLREGYVANTVDHPGAVSVHDDDVDTFFAQLRDVTREVDQHGRRRRQGVQRVTTQFDDDAVHGVTPVRGNPNVSSRAFATFQA